MPAIFRPFAQTYRYLQSAAHEQPVIFYSLVIGLAGPVAVVTVPPIRRNFFGWRPTEKVPTSYPLPNRAREEVSGFDDE